MTKEQMNLIDAAVAGNVNKDDFARLQNLLREDSVAMKHYCEQSEIHGCLEWELSQKSATTTPLVHPQKVRKRRPKVLLLTGLAAGLVLFLSLLILGVNDSPSSSNTASQDVVPPSPNRSQTLTNSPTAELYQAAPHATLARITNTQSALWKKEQLILGTWLKAGTYELQAGSAEITFASGARVVLQAPAIMEAISPHLARLTRGQGVVHIPTQARGFRLETPTNKFSDDDCSFALAVEANATEVHVIKGTVLTDQEQRLAENQSARLYDGSSQQESPRVSLRSLNRELPITEGFSETQYLRWSFDSNNLGSFPENGNHPDQDYPAQIIKTHPTAPEAEATTISGKFNRALRLNGKGSALSTGFSGISGTDERTICAWVRLPKLTHRSFHGYSIICWGDASRKDGKKWQIACNSLLPNEGVLGALRTEFGGGYVIGTTDLRDDQWHHIASVYMGGDGNVADQVLHYIDGKLEAVSGSKHININTQNTSSETSLTYIGKRLEHTELPETFTGDIDELYVFPSALSPAQIEDLRLHNRPPRQVIRSLVSRK